MRAPECGAKECRSHSIHRSLFLPQYLTLLLHDVGAWCTHAVGRGRQTGMAAVCSGATVYQWKPDPVTPGSCSVSVLLKTLREQHALTNNIHACAHRHVRTHTHTHIHGVTCGPGADLVLIVSLRRKWGMLVWYGVWNGAEFTSFD